MRSPVGAALVSILLSSISNALHAQDRSPAAPIVYEKAVASAPPPLRDTWLLPGRLKSIPAGRKVFATWLFLAVVSTITFLILQCMRSLQSGSSKRVGLKERFLATGGTGPCHPSGADGGGNPPTTIGTILLQALQLTGEDLACLTPEEAAFVIQARRELEALLQEIREIEKILYEAAKLASGLETAKQAGDDAVMANLALAQQMVQQKKEEAEKVKEKYQELKNRLQSFGPTPEQRRRAGVFGVSALLEGRTLTPGAVAAMALSEIVLTGGLLGPASLTEEQTQRLQAQTSMALGRSITVSRRLGTSPSPPDADVLEARGLRRKLVLLVFLLGGMGMKSLRTEAREALLKLQASLDVARISQSSLPSATLGIAGPVVPLSGPGRPVSQYHTLQRPPWRSPTHPGPRPTYYTLPRGFSPKAYALRISATPGSVPSHPPFPSDPGPRPPGQLAHPGFGGPRPVVLPPVDPQAGPGPGPRSAPPRGSDQRLFFPPSHPRPPSIRHTVRLQMPAPSTFQPPPQHPVSPSGLPSPRLPAAGPQRLPASGPRLAFQLFSSSSAPAPAPLPRPPAVSALPTPGEVGPPAARRPLSLPLLPSIVEELMEDAGPLPPPLPPPEDASGHGDAGEEPSSPDAAYQHQPLAGKSGGNSPGPAGAEEPHTSSENDTDEDSEDSEEPGDDDQPGGPPDGSGDEPPSPYGGGGQPHPPPEDHPGDPPNPDGGGQQQPPPPKNPGGGSQHPHDGVGLHASAERSDPERQHSDGGNHHQPPPNNLGGGAGGGGQQQGPPSDPNNDSPPAPPPADPAVLAAQLVGSGDGLDGVPPPPPPGDGGPPAPPDGAPASQEDPEATARMQERAQALLEWTAVASILLVAAEEDPNNTAEVEEHFVRGAEMLQKEKQTRVEGSASAQSIQGLKHAIAECKSLFEEFQKLMRDTWTKRLGKMRRRLTGCSGKLTRELASMAYPPNAVSCAAILKLMKRVSATVDEARAVLTQIETLSTVPFPASTMTFFITGLYGSAEAAAALVSLAAAQLAEELTEHLRAQGTSSDGSGDASAGLPGLVVGEAQAASPSDESGGALAALPGVPELEDWSGPSQALLQQAREVLKQLLELAGDTDEVLALEAQISLLECQLGPS